MFRSFIRTLKPWDQFELGKPLSKVPHVVESINFHAHLLITGKGKKKRLRESTSRKVLRLQLKRNGSCKCNCMQNESQKNNAALRVFIISLNCMTNFTRNHFFYLLRKLSFFPIHEIHAHLFAGTITL